MQTYTHNSYEHKSRRTTIILSCMCYCKEKKARTFIVYIFIENIRINILYYTRMIRICRLINANTDAHTRAHICSRLKDTHSSPPKDWFYFIYLFLQIIINIENSRNLKIIHKPQTKPIEWRMYLQFEKKSKPIFCYLFLFLFFFFWWKCK